MSCNLDSLDICLHQFFSLLLLLHCYLFIPYYNWVPSTRPPCLDLCVFMYVCIYACALSLSLSRSLALSQFWKINSIIPNLFLLWKLIFKTSGIEKSIVSNRYRNQGIEISTVSKYFERYPPLLVVLSNLTYSLTQSIDLYGGGWIVSLHPPLCRVILSSKVRSNLHI